MAYHAGDKPPATALTKSFKLSSKDERKRVRQMLRLGREPEPKYRTGRYYLD